MKNSMEIYKNQKGITLIALVLTIMLMILLGFTVAVNIDGFSQINEKTQFEKDINKLKEKIDTYYAINKTLPILNEYQNVSMLSGIKNINDNNKYYVIDLEKLDVDLNLGNDYKYIREINKSIPVPDGTMLTDVFIINEQSHTIYYPKGLTYKEITYYSVPNSYTKVESNISMNITSVQDLVQFAQDVNNGNTFEGKKILLLNDLDLSSVCHRVDGTVANDISWTPIGTTEHPFKGEFYGNNKTISNIYINQESSYKGLFGYTLNATIQGLIVTGDITAYRWIGGIVGYANGGTISNCKNYCNITGNNPSDTKQAGGIVGTSNADINNCYNYGKIVGSNVQSISQIGGIAGFHQRSKTISDCHNYGEIIGVNSVGGIVGLLGYDSIGIVTDCTNEYVVKGNSGVGGIVGTCGYSRSDESKSQILNCKNNYLVEGSKRVGGIVGDVKYTLIEKCCNLYTINGVDNIGGVCGMCYNTMVKKCYNIANLNILTSNILPENYENYIGGIVSSTNNDCIIEDCYNRGDIYNEGVYTGGIVGNLNRQSKINNCYNTGKVEGSSLSSEKACCIGGITSHTYTTSEYPEKIEIKNCYNLGEVSEISSSHSSETRISGILGWLAAGKTELEQCYNSGVISVLSNKATTTKAGGIVGVINNAAGTTITNVYEKGETAIGQNNASASNATLTGVNVNVGSNMPSILSVVNGNGHDAFVEDTNNINNAYPILKWQVQ